MALTTTNNIFLSNTFLRAFSSVGVQKEKKREKILNKKKKVKKIQKREKFVLGKCEL